MGKKAFKMFAFQKVICYNNIDCIYNGVII